MKTYLKLLLTLFIFQSLQASITAQACSGVINTYPFFESFEDPSNLWDQWNSAAVPWFFNTSGTPTPNTGPTGASDGIGYMYVEATNQLGAGVILSPCFDLTTLTSPQLTFDYHLWGQHAFRFLVQASTDGGNTWSTIVFSAINDQGPNWNSESIDLTQFASSTNLRLRFIGVVNDNGGTDEGDVALDNVRIEDAPPCFEISVSYSSVSCNGGSDASASLLIYPANTQGLSVLWSNGATTNTINNLSAGNYSVEVTDNAGCTKSKSFSIVEPGPLSVDLYVTPASGIGISDGRVHSVVSGGTAPYTYLWQNGSTGGTNFNVVPGYEELKVTDANGCQVIYPTFVPVLELCSGVYGSWPYHLSFEGGLGRFKQGSDDDRNWKRRSGSTPTQNTGPTAAAQASKYRYIESSGNGGPFKTGVIVSKRCFDISNLTDPELYFQYHMYGAQMGQLFVQTSTDGGYTWRENLWEMSGDQGNAWHEAFIDLNGVSSNTLMIRIVGRTGSGNLSDVAIDDLHIKTAGTLRSTIIDSRSSINNDEDVANESNLILKYYPNPVNNKITVQHVENTSTINVIDMQGQKVLMLKTSGTESSLDLSKLNNGMYFLQAIDIFGEMSLHKILKI